MLPDLHSPFDASLLSFAGLSSPSWAGARLRARGWGRGGEVFCGLAAPSFNSGLLQASPLSPWLGWYCSMIIIDACSLTLGRVPCAYN